ncbi:hemocyte protein-glutamine gamma-glutamyltransferase-like [Bacillus rossius redtenbacheri]|uniref:hemocyte protein-glutamine gamma-glutamyltransferase-like n=1 Tax=Bacillus rossius redtenbacheri TaxID=93214 RepID=UPI002FDE8913
MSLDLTDQKRSGHFEAPICCGECKQTGRSVAGFPGARPPRIPPGEGGSARRTVPRARRYFGSHTGPGPCARGGRLVGAPAVEGSCSRDVARTAGVYVASERAVEPWGRQHRQAGGEGTMWRPLQVDGARLYPLENSRRHHADRFEVVRAEKPSVVLRRGQEFDLLVRFRERAHDVSKDALQLVFSFGSKPDPVRGTRRILVSGSTFYRNQDNWDAKMITKDENSIKLEVRSPPDAPVGEWRLRIEARLKIQPRAPPATYNYPDAIYLLFNPWAKGELRMVTQCTGHHTLSC